MDVDSDEAHSESRERDLIKAIRSLDQTGPGDQGQHLESIWTLLTSISSSNYFAAEESVLRWLLKSMKPNNDTAETLRRFPLTWRILGCTFQRIPLFSLAKSLADRKFMAILQQTLVAVAKPNEDSSRTSESSNKRKRTPTYTFQLDSLKSREGCIATGEAILDALRVLLDRLDHTSSLGLNEKMGAEHIKALFSQPASEMVTYLAPVLTLCDLSTTATTSHLDLTESQRTWIQTLSTVWNLRLQGHADALEAAMFLSRPGFGLLGKLVGLAQDAHPSLDDRVKATWAEQLESFMHRNLMLPAKSAFLNRRDLEIPTTAIDVSKAISAVSVPVFFRLATRAPRIFGGVTASKAEGEWTEETFKLAYRRLNKLEPPQLTSSLVRILLQDAIATGSQIRLQDLRSICDAHALGDDDATGWQLLSLIAQCDPDAFLLTDKGERLFATVAERLSQDRSGTIRAQADEEAVKQFLDAIIGGFEKARDLPGFLKRWYTQLTQCDRSLVLQPEKRPVWFTDAVHRNSRLTHLIKTSSMTPKQLLNVLQWVKEQGDGVPEAKLIFLDTIASSATDEDFSDVVGPKIFDLVETVWSSAHLQGDLQSLRWPILAKTVSWADFASANKMQTLISPELKRVLSKQPLDHPDTFRAFQCATTIWLASYPDGPNEPSLSDLLASFSERLAEYVQSVDPSSPGGSWDPSKAQTRWRQKPPLDDSQPAAASYVDFSLGAASRLLPLLSRKSSSLPTFLQRILAIPPAHDASSSSSSSYSGERLTSALNAVFANETTHHETEFIGKVVDYVIDTLEFQSKSAGWDDARPRAALRSLTGVPDELLSRQQRERIMETLHGQRRKMKAKAAVSPSTWALVLGLMVKVMRRPTFYSGMAFKHLTSLASSVASSVSHSRSIQTLGMGRLVHDVSLATLRQMNDHFDEWGSAYFTKAKRYVLDADATDGDAQSALHIPIFKALVSVVSSSPHFTGDEAPVRPDAVQLRLAQMVKRPLDDYAGGWRSSNENNTQKKAQINDLLLAVDASETLTPELLRKTIEPEVTAELEAASQQSISRGHLRGWRLRTFLIKNFPGYLGQPRPTDFDKLFDLDREGGGVSAEEGDEVPDPVGATNPQETLEACVDAIVANLDHAQRLQYIEKLIEVMRTAPVADGHLLAIRRIVSQMDDDPKSSETSTSFDLATAHSRLTKYLAETRTPREFSRCAEVLHSLLDTKATSMSQWNIETTMSAISVVAANRAKVHLTSSAAVFTSLCKLASIVIRRHRLRLDDHYHILLTALESLLRALVHNTSRRSRGNTTAANHNRSNNSSNNSSNNNNNNGSLLNAKHAAMYTRLVTLVTEPSAASVSRAQYVGALDSATDAAKRVAGRHVYLLLVQYVKLQLELDIPRDVQEALEPGMYSIFDVTPPPVRKILNDAMDASGRAILREMFKRYTQFGKWSGV
ncbi:hypothetical protein SODALDRAFT_333053 [Sodiomyces alkalinus F11]|uniref:Nucleolar 27S pre-rRNA processing Urb2/Npa2 C-terminal domain-containing protein n=1 Tax=Sodiomyces alkalinus (strain CBS 110278 / VKM F-3762 / F11) TaxID=1314773 RepID=A0A3N2PVG2_SODAK|nr:hypothetical protein SODALDRAFT_333053 [Sodiomyces alkalinus F11]ROT38468.1 hypothetical protein SODALDRAFT_333053 [Sodiomyces alkalinus F11]